MTPSAQAADGRRVTRWSRELIIEKIREWAARYGEPPRSADWNPSLARWRAQEWRAERYRAGVWPSTNAAKRPFGGSFDAAVRAAGLEPHRSGPPRADGTAAARPRSGDGINGLLGAGEAGEAELRAAEARAQAAERRTARAEERAREARRRARRTSEAAARARRARDRAQAAERAAEARAEEAAADADFRVRAAADQAEAATRDAAAARAAAHEAELRAAEAVARLEAAGAGDAVAPARAAAAERHARELGALVCGEPRRLTPEELDVLRDGGPSGPTVLAAALRRLARARASGGGAALAAALGEVASAAVRWRDRL
jgi:hypothetical protein